MAKSSEQTFSHYRIFSKIGDEVMSVAYEADDQKLDLTLRTYAWFPGLTGDVGGHGVKTHVDDSFIDVLDSTDTLAGLFAHDPRYAFQALLMYYYGSWTWQFRGGVRSPMVHMWRLFERS